VGNWRYEIDRNFFALRGCGDKLDPGVFFCAVLDDDEVVHLFQSLRLGAILLVYRSLTTEIRLARAHPSGFLGK